MTRRGTFNDVRARPILLALLAATIGAWFFWDAGPAPAMRAKTIQRLRQLKSSAKRLAVKPRKKPADKSNISGSNDLALVKGRVEDAGGGPIAGARISLVWPEGVNASATSDEHGAFELRVARGEIEIEATAHGYASGSSDGVAPGEIVIALVPESVLVGRVLDLESGHGLAGITVQADELQDRSVSTDSEGRFRFEALESGRYKPIAWSDRVAGIASESVDLGPGETSPEIKVYVRPALSVRGEVRIRGGGPCPKGEVVLESDSELRRTASVGPGGRVSIGGLLPGAYAVEVSCEGYASDGSYPRMIVGESVTEQRWEVSPGVAIRGRIFDGNGAVISGAIVEAAGFEDVRETRSAADGTFEIRGLRAGSYNVVALHPDDEEISTSTTVVANMDRDALLVIERREMVERGAIEGEAKDVRGHPAIGLVIEAASESTPERAPAMGSAITDDKGRFRIADLPLGSYEVRWEMTEISGARGADVITVEVEASKASWVRITTPSREGSIRGRVIDAQGAPAHDAYVGVVLEGDPDDREDDVFDVRHGRKNAVLTRPDGAFEIRRLIPGSYSVLGWRSTGESALLAHVELGSNVTLKLGAIGSIAGVARGQAGPISRFKIEVVDRDERVVESERFDHPAGEWSIRGLQAGTYLVALESSEGFAKTEVQLGPGEDRTQVILEVKRSGTIHGHLTSSIDGRPIANQHVFLVAADLDYASLEALTDTEGSFTFRSVPAGEHTVSFFSTEMDQAYCFSAKRVRVEEGSEASLEVRVRKSYQLEGEDAGDLGFFIRRDTRNFRVIGVRPDGPAAKLLQAGDEIVSIDGVPLEGDLHLLSCLQDVPRGQQVELGLRSGARVTITAGSR
jgi:protocatechuate 3,4-dioxygenase beta subunit